MSDPLRTPARVWIKTRKPYQRHRLQSWLTVSNVRGPDGQIYTDERGQYGEHLGFADELAPRAVQHRGWYVDADQSDAIRGSVTRIHTSQGALYVPVTGYASGGGTTHYLADAERVPRGSDRAAHDAAIADAAKRADRCAEIEAERAHDEDARFRAEQQVEDEREAIGEARAAVHTLAAELRNTPHLPPAICQTIRAAIKARRKQASASVARIRALRDNILE
jgi:hypothetical protein